MTATLEHHQVADCLPELLPAEYEALKADIEARGLQQPIVLQSGLLIDGRHRAKACAELGIEAETIELAEGEDVVAYVVSANVMRRHLSAAQRALVAARLEGYKHGGVRKKKPSPEQDSLAHLATAETASQPITRAKAAKLLNVAESSIAQAKKIETNCPAEIVALVSTDKVRLKDAATIAELDTASQLEVLAEFETGHSETLRGAKQVLDRQALAELPQPEKPTGSYEVIVMDPPWQMPDFKRQLRPRKGGPEYPQMSLAEIEALPITELAADDCLLFLWTTQGWLPSALKLIEAWQFEYRFCMVWRKLTKDGTGTRGYKPNGKPTYDAEFVVVARRGKPEFTSTKDFYTILDAPYRSHSQKPEEFYSLLRRVTHGSRLDYFARTQHDGFTPWGNEVNAATNEVKQ